MKKKLVSLIAACSLFLLPYNLYAKNELEKRKLEYFSRQYKNSSLTLESVAGEKETNITSRLVINETLISLPYRELLGYHATITYNGRVNQNESLEEYSLRKINPKKGKDKTERIRIDYTKNQIERKTRDEKTGKEKTTRYKMPLPLETNSLKDRYGNQVILDPFSISYFLMQQKDIIDLNKKKVLITGGGTPKAYEINVAKREGFYDVSVRVNKNGKIKALFSGKVKKGLLEEIEIETNSFLLPNLKVELKK